MLFRVLHKFFLIRLIKSFILILMFVHFQKMLSVKNITLQNWMGLNKNGVAMFGVIHLTVVIFSFGLKKLVWRLKWIIAIALLCCSPLVLILNGFRNMYLTRLFFISLMVVFVLMVKKSVLLSLVSWLFILALLILEKRNFDMTEYPMQKYCYLVWVDFQVRFVCSSYSEASKRLDLYAKNHFGVKDIQKVPYYG